MVNHRFEKLLNNLSRNGYSASIFRFQEAGQALPSLSNKNFLEWLDSLLPDTRLIIEPKIKGCSFALHYESGDLSKAININGIDETRFIRTIINIPHQLPVRTNIQVRGELFDSNFSITHHQSDLKVHQEKKRKLSEKMVFCAFQILNSDQNQYQSLKELHKLGFDIPESEVINCTADVFLYLELWKNGELFYKYPTDGIVVKVNSRKLQKQLGENRVRLNWANSIKD